MQDRIKTKDQLLNEIAMLRLRNADLEKSNTDLIKAQEKYRDIFENCMEGIYQTTPEGRFVSANITAARLLGYDSPEDLINSVINIGTQVYAYPEDRDKALDLLSKYGAFESFEMKCRKKDGSVVWGLLSARIVRDEKGNIAYIEGTSQDITDRKLAEENLRLHDEILKNMAEGVCLVLADEGIIAYANPRFEQMFGYDPGELAGKHVSILNAPNERDPEETAGDIVKQLSATGAWNGTIQNIKKDGTFFWCRVSVSSFHHHRYGNVWIGAHADITEHIEKEDMIRNNEERFRAIADYGYDWESWVGPSGKLIWINAGVLRLTGYSPEECMAMDNFPLPLIHKQDRDRMKKLYQEAVEGSTGNDIEFLVRRKDGSARWAAASWQPIYNDAGASLGHRSSIRDITKRKQTEEALRESENRFRRFAENARDIIYRMSLPDGRYEYVSPAAYDISGFTAEEHYNGTFSIHKIIHPGFAEYIAEQWANLLKGKVSPYYEFKIITRSGDERWLHQRNVPVRDDGGSLIALEGIVTDITELKNAEETVKKHRDSLAELVKERTAELVRKSRTVEDLNMALKILLHQVQEDKENLEQRLASNVKKLVLPYLERVRKSRLDEQQCAYLDIIKANLNEIVSPFLHNLQRFNLAPREAQIANLVKEGKSTKEIAAIVGVTTNSIDSYRNNIRKKLGLNNKKVNLQSYLQSLT
jgi:PAS domain S-box-containing protein